MRYRMGLLKSLANFFRSEPDTVPVNLGRNDLCWCGSGKKYKKCHLPADEKKLNKQYPANCGSS
jgi:hypothetical protein